MAQVLIHIFPPKALGYTTLRSSCEQLQRLGQQAGSGLLPVHDCGWAGTDAYFVMAAPDSWSLKSLPLMSGTPSRLHEQAIVMIDQLMEKNLVQEGLQTHLFLVTPDGGLYLPGTALSVPLQSLQSRAEGWLSPATSFARQRSTLPWQVLGLTLAGVATAGGLGVYFALTPDGKESVTTDAGTPAALPPVPAPVHTESTSPAVAAVTTAAEEAPTLPEPAPPALPPEQVVGSPLILSKLDQADSSALPSTTVSNLLLEEAGSASEETVVSGGRTCSRGRHACNKGSTSRVC
ncbi:MAG: hypothetical protein R3E89_09875 [Thiolinea sp.]